MENMYLVEHSIFKNHGHGISIEVDNENSYQGRIPYFKAFDSDNPKKFKHIIRLHFLDSGCEVHNKRRPDTIWEIDKGDSNGIKEIMLLDNDNFPDHTNWQVACFYWNLDNGKLEGATGGRRDRFYLDKYFNGDYDENGEDIVGYVPSYTEIPDRWIYKGKHSLVGGENEFKKPWELDIGLD